MSKDEIRIVSTGGPLGADAWGVALERISDDEFEVLHRAWLDHDGRAAHPRPVRAGRDAPGLRRALRRAGPRAGLRAGRPRALPARPPASGGHFEHRRERQGDRRTGELRVEVAYRHVLQRGAAESQRPAGGGDPGQGRGHRLRQHVQGLGDAARSHRRRIAGLTCKHDASRNSRRRGAARFQDRLRTARGGAGRGASGSSAPIRRPAGSASTSAAATWPSSRSSRRRRATPCSTRCGRTPPETSSPGTSAGRLGDVVIWDNRCTMHRRDALDPNERRLLNRAQVKGERPMARRGLSAAGHRPSGGCSQDDR